MGIVAGMLCLLAGLLPESGRAQTSPNLAAKSSRYSEALDVEPKLHTKVWLVSPDSTVERLLTELMARTTPLTHLKLQAQGSVQQIPVSCYVAGVPLRDVLDGLTALSTLQWRRASDAGLQLGISEYDPWPQYRQPRIAYYGMRVLREVGKQPTNLRDLLKQGPVRLATLPSPVQRAMQALLKVRADGARPRNRQQFEWPVDPQNTGVTLDEETYAGDTRYQLRFAGERPVDDGFYEFDMRIMFTTSQAAEYQPDPNVDPPDQEEAIRKDSHFAQPVTLDLHGASLSEALRTLFTTTHIPLLAAGAEHPVHADIVFKRLPLSEALDRICAVYGYRWVRRDSGIVTLLGNVQ
jgi:hypothetical protein